MSAAIGFNAAPRSNGVKCTPLSEWSASGTPAGWNAIGLRPGIDLREFCSSPCADCAPNAQWGIRVSGGTMIASILDATRLQVARRGRQVRGILATEGHRGITDRARTVVSDWMRPKGIVWPVLPDDVVAADLTRPFQPKVPKVAPGEPISVNWVTSPCRTWIRWAHDRLSNYKVSKRAWIFQPSLFLRIHSVQIVNIMKRLPETTTG